MTTLHYASPPDPGTDLRFGEAVDPERAGHVRHVLARAYVHSKSLSGYSHQSIASTSSTIRPSDDLGAFSVVDAV